MSYDKKPLISDAEYNALFEHNNNGRVLIPKIYIFSRRILFLLLVFVPFIAFAFRDDIVNFIAINGGVEKIGNGKFILWFFQIYTAYLLVVLGFVLRFKIEIFVSLISIYIAIDVILRVVAELFFL